MLNPSDDEEVITLSYRVECQCGVTFQADEPKRDSTGRYVCGWVKCCSEPRKVEEYEGMYDPPKPQPERRGPTRWDPLVMKLVPADS